MFKHFLPETRGGRYLGGTIGQPSLTILRASKLDIGDYTCQLGKEYIDNNTIHA